MKRNSIYSALGMAVLAFSLQSCTHSTEMEAQESMYVSVRANTQGATKTSLSDLSVLWSENDQIAFFSSGGGKGTLTLKSGAGTSSAVFEGTAQGSVTPFFGFYPAANGISKANSCINFSVPQVQMGKEGGFAEGMNPSLAVFPTADSEAYFYNLSGMLKLTLKGSQTIFRIKLVSLDAGDQLWGNVAAAINTNKEVSEWTQTYSGGDNILFLDFTDGLTLSSEGKTVYFAVPPGTLSSGFKVVVYDKYQAVDEFLTYTDYTIKRSVIQPMAAVQIGKYCVLDAEESANCYNICKTNTELPFKFCAVKGNSLEALAADSAVEYWESQTTSPSEFNGGALGYLLSGVGLSKHCVCFTLEGRAGSASIAAKSGNEILWNWHIWITNSLPSVAKMANGTRIMDTNLGAVGPGTASLQPVGLLYQWGRKDPFPAPYHVNYSTMMYFQPAGVITYEAKTDATLAYTLSHPGTFIDNNTGKWEAGANTSVWAAEKTIYDPCPPGYRVPTKAELSNLTLSSWDATYYRYTESSTAYHFNATSRSYYSSQGAHVNETAHTGYYWTSDHSNANLAQMATFSTSAAGTISGGSKSIGAAVRCVAEVSAQPSPSSKTVKVSLIGDSISTFGEYINSGNLAYYPRAEADRAAADIEVVQVNQTYWWQLINTYMSNAALEKNDAWSGSCMGGYDNTSMVARYTQDRVGNPDVIIINAGTNDLVRENHYLIDGVAMSEEDMVHPTEAEMQAVFTKAETDYTTLSESLFIESYVKLIHRIRADLPGVQFLLIIGDRFSQAERKAIISIAEKYGAKYVDFLALGRNCLEKQSYVHPSIRGMATMSKYIYDCQGEWLESLGN